MRKVTQLEALQDTHPDQLLFDLDWGSEPWNGVSPRYLCVDNSSRKMPKARADFENRRFTSGAQLQLWVHPHPLRRCTDVVQI